MIIAIVILSCVFVLGFFIWTIKEIKQLKENQAVYPSCFSSPSMWDRHTEDRLRHLESEINDIKVILENFDLFKIHQEYTARNHKQLNIPTIVRLIKDDLFKLDLQQD